MCSQDQAKQAAKDAIEETLFRRDPHTGESRLQYEVENHIKGYIDSVVSQLTMRFGITLLALVVAGTAAWYSQQNRVANNRDAIEDGGRYTQEEHDTYAEEVDRRFEELNADIDEIKSDVKAIRKAVTGN